MRRNLPIYACEPAGTAIMLFVGVSAVAFMWAPGSPVPAVGSAFLRRLVTGIFFAAGGTAVVYSPLGQRSGAHINPAVTIAFWRMGKVPPRDVAGYVAAQVLGAVCGVFAAGLAFPRLMRAVHYAATVPGDGYTWAGALVAETIVTFVLVLTILICVNRPTVAHATGVISGLVVALLVALEAPISGTSLNPARSLAPALLAPDFASLWVYFVGPIAGALLAAAAYAGQWGPSTVCAKLYHTHRHRCPFEGCGYGCHTHAHAKGAA
jgi:aquaporin Z